MQLIGDKGGVEASERPLTYLTLLRGKPPEQVTIYRNLSFARIIDHTEADLPLAGGDLVIVETAKRVEDAAATQRQDGKIEAHDRLLVTISDLVGPNRNTVVRCRVDPKGNIKLPFLDRLKVGDETLADAEKAIDKAYLDASLLTKCAGCGQTR